MKPNDNNCLTTQPLDHLTRSAGISRREFLKDLSRFGMVVGGAGVALTCPLPFEPLLKNASAKLFSPASRGNRDQIAPLARYWISTQTAGNKCLSCHIRDENLGDMSHDHGEVIIKCRLCAQECLIREGERGQCRTRVNVNGQLRSLVYGHPVSVHVDPIEKKPFYHFLPGSEAFSMATAGCPLHCKFCQNWEISQARPEDYPTEFIPPETIVRAAERRRAPVIAFTYNEPTVFTEYLTDIAGIARKQGIRSVLVSCGLMNIEPLDEMCDVLDAIKIDLKGFSRDFYRRVCNADLEPVLRSIKHVSKRGVHLEIVNLVVPTLNDSKQMLVDLVDWIVGEVGPDVPVHFTRFHPDYQMLNLPPTPVATLEQAYDIAKQKGIHYPYVGNYPGHPGNNTYCPGCGKVVIQRSGFFVTAIHMKQGRCEFCDHPISGVWK
ncbi:MAG: AmmeMemoRadiSam system radical SAM enzyme [Thermodesulfobacteriota bacterium]|nr:AmmeMemoRadiSam system radical SAM enzyme [Thermodesulfobacteriota bacterium]